MRVRLFLVILSLSILPVAPSGAQPLARDRTPDPTGTAVIRGHIIDAATGDPVRQVRVRATDDAGEFRLFGVDPGDYYLGATYRYAGMPEVAGNQPDYAPTHFPGTGNLVEAQRLRVEAGTVMTGIDLTLVPVRAVRVSGVAIAASGRPMTSGAVVFTQPGSPAPGGSKTAPTKPDG